MKEIKDNIILSFDQKEQIQLNIHKHKQNLHFIPETAILRKSRAFLIKTFQVFTQSGTNRAKICHKTKLDTWSEKQQIYQF